MIVKVIPVGPLSMNCSVIVDEDTGQSVVTDPGADLEVILKALEGTTPKYILATHGHIDHVGQVKGLKERLGVPFLVHKEDLFCSTTQYGRALTFMWVQTCPALSRLAFLKEGMELSFGKIRLKVEHTPGHTPGHCCFYSEEKLLIAGDLLFRDSVGRWDLPGGSLEDLKKSLLRAVLELLENVRVITGHGEETTIGREKKFNPLLREILSH
jgi:hydroxyacylglutathione hydrolase